MLVTHSYYPSPQLHFLYALLEPRHSEAWPTSMFLCTCGRVLTPSMCYFLPHEYPRISAQFIVRRHRSLETLVLTSGLVDKAFGYHVWSPGIHPCTAYTGPGGTNLQRQLSRKKEDHTCVFILGYAQFLGQAGIHEASPLKGGREL